VPSMQEKRSLSDEASAEVNRIGQRIKGQNRTRRYPVIGCIRYQLGVGTTVPAPAWAQRRSCESMNDRPH
jgi:hypothetical protein